MARFHLIQEHCFRPRPTPPALPRSCNMSTKRACWNLEFMHFHCRPISWSTRRYRKFHRSRRWTKLCPQSLSPSSSPHPIPSLPVVQNLLRGKEMYLKKQHKPGREQRGRAAKACLLRQLRWILQDPGTCTENRCPLTQEGYHPRVSVAQIQLIRRLYLDRNPQPPYKMYGHSAEKELMSQESDHRCLMSKVYHWRQKNPLPNRVTKKHYLV